MKHSGILFGQSTGTILSEELDEVLVVISAHRASALARAIIEH